MISRYALEVAVIDEQQRRLQADREDGGKLCKHYFSFALMTMTDARSYHAPFDPAPVATVAIAVVASLWTAVPCAVSHNCRQIHHRIADNDTCPHPQLQAAFDLERRHVLVPRFELSDGGRRRRSKSDESGRVVREAGAKSKEERVVRGERRVVETPVRKVVEVPLPRIETRRRRRREV